MDEAQKARIRLEHWINHNYDHLKGYLEVSNSLDAIGLQQIADKIRNAAEYIDRANDEFRKALDQLAAVSPSLSTSSGCGCSEHSHAHGHTHSHTHSHEGAHECCHDHSHSHSHDHPHDHSHDDSHDHAHDHSHSHDDHGHGGHGHRHD